MSNEQMIQKIINELENPSALLTLLKNFITDNLSTMDENQLQNIMNLLNLD